MKITKNAKIEEIWSNLVFKAKRRLHVFFNLQNPLIDYLGEIKQLESAQN